MESVPPIENVRISVKIACRKVDHLWCKAYSKLEEGWEEGPLALYGTFWKMKFLFKQSLGNHCFFITAA